MTRALLPFELGGHLLAIDAGIVTEVNGPREWVAIPRAPATIPGALAWRGRALAVIDLGIALQLEPLAAPRSRSRNLIVQLSDDTVVLTVDRVREARPATALAPVHAAELGLPGLGELEIDGRMALVIDLEAWLQTVRGTA
ncbi:MAG: chemotaxis protein CheW [Myxococcales bacterium]|nr:chemotaxis protein CheW [Myxococcales bacterium]